MRDFTNWLASFRESISGYDYYINFDKVFKNVDNIKVELNILNSLIGSKNIEAEFEELMAKYPETLKCIPLLLAVRENEIYAQDKDGEFKYNFKNANYSIEQYKLFMTKTGLFDLLSNRLVANLADYATGVETGLDSNGRKNRGGHQMENLVESFLVSAGLKADETYFKEMTISTIEKKWGINLSTLSNQGKVVKRFDFVAKKGATIYGIEANFYASSGSKLNETARSYKNMATGSKEIANFEFVWFTDGKGWHSAKNNLEETFDAMEHVYNILDLENGVVNKVLI